MRAIATVSALRAGSNGGVGSWAMATSEGGALAVPQCVLQSQLCFINHLVMVVVDKVLFCNGALREVAAAEEMVALAEEC